MKIARYKCRNCHIIRVKTVMSMQLGIPHTLNCTRCTAKDRAELINGVNGVLPYTEYVEPGGLLLDDISNGYITGAAATNMYIEAAEAKLKELEEINTDLRDSIIELQEWAEEQAVEAEQHKKDTHPVTACKAYAREEVLLEMVEHCMAALE